MLTKLALYIAAQPARVRRFWAGEEGGGEHAGDRVRDAAVCGARGHPGAHIRKLQWTLHTANEGF